MVTSLLSTSRSGHLPVNNSPSEEPLPPWAGGISSQASLNRRVFLTRLGKAAGILLLSGSSSHIFAESPLADKTPPGMRGVLHTKEMRQNAIRNIERYDWARTEMEQTLSRVDPYLKLSYEELWQLLPGEKMPRSLVVDPENQGCPQCGAEIYNQSPKKNRDYGIFGDPWRFDPFSHPWKIQCPNCKGSFPRNDFAAFYQSALDDKSVYHPSDGNPKFLQAQDNDPLGKFVDDGRGVTVGGNKWFFAAHYAALLWVELVQVSRDLANLYTYTGNEEYARRAGILLHRMADLYPGMDYMESFKLGMEASSGCTGRGRVIGMIWETLLAPDFINAYDSVAEAISTDKTLAEFLKSRRVTPYVPHDATDVSEHIRKDLIGEVAKSVLDGRIEGNQGMHQYTMGLAAIVYNQEPESSEWLNWLFEPGKGNIPKILQENLSRDGFSPESSIGYATIPIRSFGNLAEVLAHSSKSETYGLYNRFPKFDSGFMALAKTRLLDAVTPVIGDDSGTLLYNPQTYPTEMLLNAYRNIGSKELAREIWYSNGRSWDGLHGSIYEADPSAIVRSLEKDWGTLAMEPPFQSFLTSGYGLGALQAPNRAAPRGTALNFGRMGWGHGHADRLGLHVFAFGTSMTPDLGYPTRAEIFWPDANGFSLHVVSHNTVMVDDINMDIACSYSGKTKLFAESGPLHVMDIDGGGEATQRGAGQSDKHQGRGVPPFPGVTTYRRCLVMVDVNDVNSYLVDIFWVRGGQTHRLIQNGGGPDVTTQGLDLTAKEGTYAGENVKFGEFFDGPTSEAYEGSGFMFLDRVETAHPDSPFSVDWSIIDRDDEPFADGQPHLKIHNLSPVEEATLVDGHPPKRFGNPERLRYLHRVRRGKDLHSQFITVLEPYKETPFISKATVLQSGETAAGFSAVLKIDLKSGQTDTIAITENGGEIKIGNFTFNGRVGLSRTQNGVTIEQSMIAATLIAQNDASLQVPFPGISGELLGISTNKQGETVLELTAEQPLPDDMTGHYVVFDNHQRSDAAFLISEIPDPQEINIGKVSLFEKWIDPNRPSLGGEDVIGKGAKFFIPSTRHATYSNDLLNPSTP